MTWDEGKAYFTRYGYNTKNWKSNREGNFYPSKPGIQSDGLIHLVSKSLDQNRRVFLAIHEVGHAVWHYVLTNAEWDAWFTPGWTTEEFADDFARRLMDDGLSKEKKAFFDRLETRLTETGTHSIRP